jgi:glycosyltransferase A (GT-A) superfamily protein (DUF2064 family)
MIIKNTAILIFVRDTQEELKHKSLLRSSYSQEYAFISALNRRAEKIAQNSKLPYYIVNSSKQIGTTFKEKLKNAIQYVFDRGFENVISLGNDVPQLTSQKLIETKNHLLNNELVFGETNKGGIYLLGISRNAFANIDFDKLDWQSTKLASSIAKQSIQKGLRLFKFLDILNEINNNRDALNFLAQLQDVEFLSLNLQEFYRFTSKRRSTKIGNIFPFKTYNNRTASFRGPPVMA